MKKFEVLPGTLALAAVAICGLLVFAGCATKPAKPADVKPVAAAPQPAKDPAVKPAAAAAMPPPAKEKPAPATTAVPPVKPLQPPVAAAPKPPAPPAPAPKLDSKKSKTSYSLGVSFGKDMKRVDLDVDMDLLYQGMKDALSGGKLALGEEEIQIVLMDLRREMMQKQQQHMKEMADKNKAEAEKFLAENKKLPGVVTLPDGLQYKVVKQGDGKIPAQTDTVMVNYRGKFLDGTEFDSSYKRKQPAPISLNAGVIRGMSEGIGLMKVGSSFVLYIPSDLAYGDGGYPPTIAPNAALIFEVELLSIEETPKEPAPPTK